jgi:hypothetical protein
MKFKLFIMFLLHMTSTALSQPMDSDVKDNSLEKRAPVTISDLDVRIYEITSLSMSRPHSSLAQQSYLLTGTTSRSLPQLSDSATSPFRLIKSIYKPGFR